MKLSVAALGSFVVSAVVLVSIFVIVPAITDDDDDGDSTTLPGVPITTASTNEDGSAFFEGEDGEEIEVVVHRADGTMWDNVSVHYLDGDGYELFVAEDRLGRFLPSWAFFTQANIVDLTTRAEGMVEVVPDTDQFNAMLLWIEDVKGSADARRCVTERQLMDEAGTRLALTSATLSPLSSLAAGVGTTRNTVRFLVDIIRREPSDIRFNVFELQVDGITATIQHYESISSEECRPDPTVSVTPAPSDTPRPGQPTATPLPQRPTDTPAPGQPANTPRPGQPTGTPGLGQPTGTPQPQPKPTDTPSLAPTDAPVEQDVMRITDIQPPLGTNIAENAVISVTVEYRVSSVAGVSISGIADVDVNLLSLGIHSLANTQGTLKLTGAQFGAGARLCAVSITMERLTPGGGEQLASDSRGYSTPVC